jgi:CheY-like chemotaxis protein
MKVLIAEDEASIARSYRTLLESEGYEVILTRDGEECLQTYLRALTQGSLKKLKNSNQDKKDRLKDPRQSGNGIRPPFHVVVLDVRMPKRDGIEVAKEIMSICPEQKILMASAYGEEIAPKMLIVQLGNGVDVLQKPFDLEKFAAMISDLN